MKRLTRDQKYVAVVETLSAAINPMTAHSIGKKIGFQNGQPVKSVLEEMTDAGWFTSYEGTFFNRRAVWYWINEKNKAVALEELFNSIEND